MTTPTPTSGAADLPEALRLANVLELAKRIDYYNEFQIALDGSASELRRQHTEIEDLRAQLESIGAGGVSGRLVQAISAEPAGAGYAALPGGWPALFRCDSCDGNGEIGEPMGMGHFQPPERARCPDCEGKGWCSEEPAFRADHMHDFADRTHALRASHGQAPAGAAQQEPAGATTDPQLLKFYGVTTDAELIAAQARHIERLQAKLPQAPSFAPQLAREG